MYLPGVRHGVANSSDAPVKVIVMGCRIPAGTKVEPTPKPMLASADDAASPRLSIPSVPGHSGLTAP
jgi:hypothetical protein